MKVCANLGFMFSEAGPLLDRYKAAAKAGFKYVETDFPRQNTSEEVSKALSDSNLTQVLVNCDQGDVDNGDMGFAAIPGEEEKFKRTIQNSITYAKALKCSRLHILSGKDLNNRNDQVATMVKNLKWASNHLKSENISVLIEPINQQSKPGYFLNDYDTALEILEKVNCDNVKLQMDIFHLQKITGNITHNIKKLFPYIGHIQVAQPPLRHEPSFCGEIDYGYVFSLLKELGYEGYVGCEYKPSTSSASSLDWVTKYGLSFD